jgi:RNA polymerase sigma factor (sigma-70 family)
MDGNSESTAATERELVLRARSGDSEAIADLYTRYWRAARATAYAIVRDVATAEDVAGEAFRTALPALKTLRDPDRFAPWLRRIVRRVAGRSAKAAARASEPLDDAAPSAAPDPSETLETRELALRVWQAVERLPPAEREAIVLYYFEGYASDDAARFLDVPVGTLRRRLHDGRLRLRKFLTDGRTGERAEQRTTARLRARVEALLSEDSSPEEWYEVTRHVLLRRPVPYQLLASLTGSTGNTAMSVNFGQHASRLMARSRGPLLDDSGPVGEAARALRAALHDFQEWTIDTQAVLEAFPNNVFRRSEGGRTLGINPELMPPGFSSGEPSRYLRVTRGLLFGDTQGAVVDLAEVFLRSRSLASFKAGMRPGRLSDVLDVYWIDVRPIELSEVEDWVTELAATMAPGARPQCSAQAGPRYRTALRLTFEGDVRPAAIGGVLAAWPGAPEGVHAVHVRLYLEPWAQIRSGQVITAESVPRWSVDTGSGGATACSSEQRP